jgi:hypothetical protein
MYELPSSLLSANPIHRYLLNSPMQRSSAMPTAG